MVRICFGKKKPNPPKIKKIGTIFRCMGRWGKVLHSFGALSVAGTWWGKRKFLWDCTVRRNARKVEELSPPVEWGGSGRVTLLSLCVEQLRELGLVQHLLGLGPAWGCWELGVLQRGPRFYSMGNFAGGCEDCHSCLSAAGKGCFCGSCSSVSSVSGNRVGCLAAPD